MSRGVEILEEFQHVGASSWLYSSRFSSLARSYVLRYFCTYHSDLSKQLVLFVLWFTTHIECFDLGRNLVEVVFRSVGMVPRLGLLVNVP